VTIIATPSGRQQAIADNKTPAGDAANRYLDLKLKEDELSITVAFLARL
jgi:hypothetical protein